MTDDKELEELKAEAIKVAANHMDCEATSQLAYAMGQTASINASLLQIHTHLLAAHFRIAAQCASFHGMSEQDAVGMFRAYFLKDRAESGNAPTSGSLQ